MSKATLLAAALILQLPISAKASDVAGSKDHPLVPRFDGAEIFYFSNKASSDYDLVVGPIDLRGKQNNPESIRSLTGRFTEIHYQAPRGPSVLDIFTKYETALDRAGFEIIFSCHEDECGTRDFNLSVATNPIAFSEVADQRYLAASLPGKESNAYVSLLLTGAGAETGPRIQLQVVEIESRTEIGKSPETVDAKAIAEGLKGDGRVALHDITFHNGRASLQPSSNQILAEVAKLMKSQPGLRLVVVGHANSRGNYNKSMRLSRQRAAAVKKHLVEKHRIADHRLLAAGIGFLAPLTSNESQEGQAANSRIELVKR